jgi:hypothetical protein
MRDLFIRDPHLTRSSNDPIFTIVYAQSRFICFPVLISIGTPDHAAPVAIGCRRS